MRAAASAATLNSIGSRTTDMEIDLMVTVYALSVFGWTVSAAAMDPVASNAASPNPARRMREIVLCIVWSSLW